MRPGQLVVGIAAVAFVLGATGISAAQAASPIVNIPVSSDGFEAPPAFPDVTEPDDGGTRATDDDLVDVPDPLLAEAIRARTGQSDITRGSMRKVLSLKIDGSDVRDLTGLEHATRLTKLEMRGTLVTTLAPLAEVEPLMYLYAGTLTLSNGEVRESHLNDISALAALSSLDYVSLNGAQISDIKPLRGAKKLVRVEVAGVTALHDLSPLEESPMLREVYAQNTAVSDLSPLANLLEMRTISVPNANVSDISTVAGLPELTILNVNGNHVTDISMLDSWPKLQQVGFRAQTVSLPRVYPSATEATYVNLDTALPFRLPDGEPVAATSGAEALEAGGTRWTGLDGTETELSVTFANAPAEGRPSYSATATYPVTFADFDLAPAQGSHVSATAGSATAFDFSTVKEFSGGEYTLVSEPIPGMSLSQGGQLAGTPTTAGRFEPVVKLTDRYGNAITRSFVLEVALSAGAEAEEPPKQETEQPELAKTGANAAFGVLVAASASVIAGLAVLVALRRRSNA